MEEIKNKLNYLERALSVKHLARDIILFQVIFFLCVLITTIAYMLIINYALGTPSPATTVQGAVTQARNMSWIIYLISNVGVMWIGGKFRNEAIKTKKELLDMIDEVKEQ